MKYLWCVLLSILAVGCSRDVEFIAHRGASYLAPENTVASAALAWQLGADAVEVDVYLSKDKRIVVIHDKDTKRTAGMELPVAQTSAVELRQLGYTMNDIQGFDFRAGRGCANCHFTGYSGRVGVFELLVLDELVKDAILSRKTSYEIRRISLESSGLVTLLEEGMVKSAMGATTIEEVLARLPRLTKPRPLRELKRLLGVR